MDAHVLCTCSASSPELPPVVIAGLQVVLGSIINAVPALTHVGLLLLFLLGA